MTVGDRPWWQSQVKIEECYQTLPFLFTNEYRSKELRKPVIFRIINPESLSNNDFDGYENVTWKVKSRCFKFYRAYSISFNSSIVGNFFWSWILKDCIKVQEKKKKVRGIKRYFSGT